MIVAELFVALAVALVLTVLFVGLAGWRRPGTSRRAGLWSAVLFFFLMVFAASWAGGVWVRPVGPDFWGVYWLSFVVVGLITALLLAAASTPLRFQQRRAAPRSADQTEGELGQAASTTAAFGALFWVLLVLLPLVAAASYAVDGLG